ncbi:DNA repair protein RecN [Thiomicrospira sp. ALE5]|uniref:DNA repair protein RecN n=1 Tax=Thiomicrospira sp. ALE5 TaxID=748650 RepID=UPI0008E27A2B|nr:DNA repair protein RecN [Thiomicrospira sp. ALE5]SFR51428.1 DNA repair protein RecN (Recombination protein N) [Thiomicrospira sp. ALE5]
MLVYLHIQNLALIDQLELDFKPGLSVLTGETGAGKSILLDGLGLILGERADSSLVRHGKNKATVTAEFDLSDAPDQQAWLQQHDLDDENQINNCIIQRSVRADGRSKAYINGRPTTLTKLKELGQQLIIVHGQHQHQALLNLDTQRDLLDRFGQHNTLVSAVKAAFTSWHKLTQKLKQIQDEQQDAQAKLELLTFKQQEFAKVKPLVGEFDLLAEEQRTLAHANDIKTAGLNAAEHLDGEHSTVSFLTKAQHEIERAAGYSPELAQQQQRLETLLIEVQELASELHHYSDKIELDPYRLDEVDTRLGQLHALAKKYHLDPNGLADYFDELNTQLTAFTQHDQFQEELEAAINKAYSSLQTASKSLSDARQHSANILGETITSAMQALGMAKGRFEVALEPSALSAFGQDKINFLVQTNPGQPAQPLNKIASGGELSRISLAIQVACAQVSHTATLIFDEVDVGIGGAVAEIVGQKMRTLGHQRQVFAVTHLGQVASYGNHHFKVAKQNIQDETQTQVEPLTAEARTQEIARMIGGIEITEQTLGLASELLNQAKAF